VFLAQASQNGLISTNLALIASKTWSKFCQTLKKKKVIITAPNGLIACVLGIVIIFDSASALSPLFTLPTQISH